MSNVNNDLRSQKNLLYRDHYRRTIKGIVLFSIVTVTLVLILASLVLTQEQPKYYATTTSGQVIPMHSLSDPVVTNHYLLQWASLATRSAFNLNWVEYQSDMNRAKADFTPGGWSKFTSAMKQSGLITTIQDQKLEMSAVVSGAPVIVSTGIVRGRFTWRVEIPLLVTFTSASQTKEARWLATMNIQRISTLSAYKGIQISDFKVAPH